MDEQRHIPAHYDISPGHEREILTAFEKLAAESRKTPGCVRDILAQDVDNQQTHTVIECWASQEAFKAHTAMPHFVEFQALAQGKRENMKTDKLKQVS